MQLNIKQILSLFIVGVFLTACGSSDSSDANKKEKQENNETTVKIPTSLTLKWSNSDINLSESAIYDSTSDAIYVSNHSENGYIAKINKDGTTNTKLWYTNVSSPKGLAIKNNILYVTDNKLIVAIDTTNNTNVNEYNISQTFNINGFLNDIVYDESSDKLYISKMALDYNDSLYSMSTNGVFTLFQDVDGKGTTHNQNGVDLDSKGSVVYQGIVGQLSSKNISSGETLLITSSIDNLEIDGITNYKNVGYFVSGSTGGLQNLLYFIANDGTATVLDKGDEKSLHDIYYSSDLDLLLVPSLGGDTPSLKAYEIK